MAGGQGSRGHGQRGQGHLSAFPRSVLNRSDYPPVAFFSDWDWRPAASLAEEHRQAANLAGQAGANAQPIFQFWDATVAESQRLLEGFSQAVSSPT